MELYNVIDGDSLNVVLQKEDIFFNDSWVFWYDDSPPKGIKQVDYESAIKELGSFSTVQEFWRLWTNLNDVKTLPDYSNIRLFRKGVKPMWEDPANTNGGKWVIPAPTVADAERLWSIVIIAAIGEQFDEGIDLTGIVLSLRPKENILQLWTKTAVTDPIRQAVQRAALQQKLEVHPDLDIIFQVHFASLEFTKNFVKRPRSSNKKRKPKKLTYGGGNGNGGGDSDESDSRITPTGLDGDESGEEDLPFFVPIGHNGASRASPESPRTDTVSPQLSLPRSSSSMSQRSSDAVSPTPAHNSSPRSAHVPRNPPSTTPPPRPTLTPHAKGFNTGSPTTSRYSPQPTSPIRNETRARSHSAFEPSMAEIPFAPIRPLTPNIPPSMRSVTPSVNQTEKYHPPIPRSPPKPHQPQQVPTSPTRPPSRFGCKSPMIPFGVNNGSNNGSRPPSRASPFPGSPAFGRPPSRSASTSPSFHNRQLHQTQVAELLKRVSKAIEQPTAYIDLKDDTNAIALVSELVSISLRKKRTNNLGLNTPTPTRSSPAVSSPSSPLDSPNPPSSPRLMPLPQFISSGASAFSIKRSQDSPPFTSPESMDPALKRDLLSFDLNGLPQPVLVFTSEVPTTSEVTSPSNSGSPQPTTPAAKPESPKIPLLRRNSSLTGSKLRDTTHQPVVLLEDPLDSTACSGDDVDIRSSGFISPLTNSGSISEQDSAVESAGVDSPHRKEDIQISSEFSEDKKSSDDIVAEAAKPQVLPVPTELRSRGGQNSTTHIDNTPKTMANTQNQNQQNPPVNGGINVLLLLGVVLGLFTIFHVLYV